MTKQTPDYQTMMQELQTILAELQSEDLDVDAAIAKHQRGQELIDTLEKYLETAENKIIEHPTPRSNKSS